MKLSVCIITRDDEKNLKRCLECLVGYAFELVVVDTGSVDGTRRVAASYTDRIYDFAWCDDFGAAKNYAVSKANNPYVMVIDSDEFLEELDVRELDTLIKKNPDKVGRIQRRNHYQRNGQPFQSMEYINRIFPKDKYEYQGRIHEQLVRLDGEPYFTYRAPVLIEHAGYEGTLSEMTRKANRNIRMLRREVELEGEDPYLDFQLGKSYYMMEKYEEASEYFERALTFPLDTRLEYVVDLVESYGYALINSRQIEKAAELIRLEDSFGRTSDFQFLLGLIYMNREQFEKAISCFEKAVTLKNGRVQGVDSYLSYYNAGVICECLGDVDRARDFYQKCGDYNLALERIKTLPIEITDDTTAILAASACEKVEDWDGEYRCIQRGLQYNSRNYELYFMLGNLYRSINERQAMLYYDQAVFYCENEDLPYLEQVRKEFRERTGVTIPKTAIVILSYNGLEQTRHCVESIRATTAADSYELIVVDNASTDGSVEWLRQQKDIKLWLNKDNAGFPKGCNQGIALAEPDSDILLLNNDTLMPEHALLYLRMGLYSEDAVAAAGSVSNYCPNYQNVPEITITDQNYERYARKYNQPQANALEYKSWLVGFCVLYRRTALETVKLTGVDGNDGNDGEYLDERFTPGNFEDTDLGYRLNAKNYRQVLCHNSFVFHYGSQSFSKKKNQFNDLLATNEQKFIDKWEMHPSANSYVKSELISLMVQRRDEKFEMLELQCGTGASLARLKYLYPHANVTGMDTNEKCTAVAGTVIGQQGSVYCRDFFWGEDKEMEQKYDVILASDTYENAPDLGALLRKMGSCLKKDGYLIGSFYGSGFAEKMVERLLVNRFEVQDMSFRKGKDPEDGAACQYFFRAVRR